MKVKLTKWKSIVVALVLILGFVGYYVWDNCQKAKKIMVIILHYA